MDARGDLTVAFISARRAVVFAKRKPRGMRQVIDKNVGVVIATEKMQRAKTGVTLKVRQGRNTQRDGAVHQKGISADIFSFLREGGFY